jgi:hypothetical protein
MNPHRAPDLLRGSTRGGLEIVMRNVSLVITMVIAVGCASTGTSPGARPHDMSAAAHDREAAGHEAASVEHEARYEPGIADPCDPRMATCWNAMRTSTERHHGEAETHAHIAAEHRNASAALRQAEATACAGMPAVDRDASPFTHVDDIARVETLVEGEPGSDATRTNKSARTYVAGAVVTFRDVPGLTAPRLQQMIDCHLARNAALGHVVPEMPDCPLVPRGASARVRSIGTAFAVEIRGADAASAREIVARAERLVRRDKAVRP